MEEMANVYPTLVQLVNIGHTAEGREMVAMKLSKEVEQSAQMDGAMSSSVKKAGFVITGAQHAREVRRVLLWFKARGCRAHMSAHVVDCRVYGAISRTCPSGRRLGAVRADVLAGLLRESNVKS